MSEPIQELKADIDDLKDATRAASEQAVNAAGCKIEQARQYIRANPAPLLLGALATGIVLGLLVPRIKEDSRLGHLDDRLDELKDLLASLGNKVTSTAGERYEDIGAAIGKAVKTAKKRFNLS